MGGFKEGASSSPFDTEEDEEDDDPVADDRDAPVQTAETGARSTGTREESRDASGGELPWIYRREGARSDRDVTKQLHLQQETAQRETEFLADLERELDEKVYRADLREAALLVAMDNPGLVADQLREWGYDYE
jgi:hypothetical protein